MKLFIAFLGALPEILKLIKRLEEMNRQAKVDRKVKDDIKAINDAFKNDDAEELNRIFRNKPPGLRDH